MPTAQSIIEDALIEIGVLVAGGSLGSSDLAWCARKFNRFIKSRSCEGLNLYTKTKENFALVSGTGSYSIGSGGTFDTGRPLSIRQAWIREDGSDYLLQIRPIDEYQQIPQKDQGGRPYQIYYDRSYPLGTIYMHYVPDAAYDFWIVSEKELTTYDDVVDDEVIIPSEYEIMFVTNLALQFCPRYGRTPSRELKEEARDSLLDIRSNSLARSMVGVNVRISGSGSYYDIETG